ncbi:hypothetical protein, partial [Vibrio sp. 10N.286.49.B3]|uniref:hypothetical protein n=1 Tax=Vibrio sp. 10N.286.49.B3 TaxID=1880855 RepID=UPI0018E431A8
MTYLDGNDVEQSLIVDNDGNVTIPAGITAIQVAIPTTQDEVFEGDETFGLIATEANDITTNGETGVTGQATIKDDGTGPGDDPD